MSDLHCPDCYRPVQARPGAREGRCDACRPRPERSHSVPRRPDRGDPNLRHITQ